MATRTLKATAVTSMSALALAAMTTTAQADGPELYGLVDIGLESYSADEEAAGLIFAGFNSVVDPDSGDPQQSDAKDVELSNGMTSRIGVRGGEDLTDNLRASYNFELQIDVLADGRNRQNTRLGWVALEGDWGMTKIGTQWMALYEFGGWNTHRTDVHGYGSYYFTTSVLRDSAAFGFRQSSAVSYQYGSAWGHSDPFAFNITAGIGEGDDNESGVNSIQAAGQYTFNDAISLNAVIYQEIYDGPSDLEEATLYNVGARWNVTPALELAANYTAVTDFDADDSDRQAFAVAGMYDFGQGWDGHLGFSRAAGDDLADIDANVYGFVRHSFTDRTNARFEFEHIEYDGDADDATETIGMVALQHNF